MLVVANLLKTWTAWQVAKAMTTTAKDLLCCTCTVLAYSIRYRYTTYSKPGTLQYSKVQHRNDCTVRTVPRTVQVPVDLVLYCTQPVCTCTWYVLGTYGTSTVQVERGLTCVTGTKATLVLDTTVS